MKNLHLAAWVITGLLSLAAGAAKVMKVPQEAAFFEAVGLEPIYMTVLGAAQIGAGVLLLLPKTRKIGAILAALAFLISVIMIFKTGQTGFALVSLIPVALALYVFATNERAQNTARG